MNIILKPLVLFFKPRTFFKDYNKRRLPCWPTYLVFMLMYGISLTIERIDKIYLFSSLGKKQSQIWKQIGVSAGQSWLDFWLLSLTGSLTGIFIYWVGGWCYSWRLQLCSISHCPSIARRLFLVSGMVFALPVIILTIALSGMGYENYLSFATSTIGKYTIVLMCSMSLWSIYTSSQAVKATFGPDNNLSVNVFFLILPAIICIFSYAGITYSIFL